MIYCDIEDNIQHIVDVGSIASDGLTLNSEDTRTTKKKSQIWIENIQSFFPFGIRVEYELCYCRISCGVTNKYIRTNQIFYF